ncbi:MAG: histidine triad nucleotide-binding protein [Candidatus Fimenecus sp.]
MENCIFCKIARGELGTNFIYEDEFCVAFKDLSPQAKVHLLIIPKLHIENTNEINEDNSEFISKIFEAIPKLTEKLGISDYRVISNCGKDAYQSVMHLHFHILSGQELSEKIV